MEANVRHLQYRVRPVTRYIVTRYVNCDGETSGSSQMKGEYDNADVAYEVGYALCRAEHEQLGYPPGSSQVIYPERPQYQQVPEIVTR